MDWCPECGKEMDKQVYAAWLNHCDYDEPFDVICPHCGYKAAVEAEAEPHFILS